MNDTITIPYNELVNRQHDLNAVIAENRKLDPKNENIELREQNLINLGAMQMINELIDKYQKQ